MGEVTFTTSAYAKMILHAAKYPHCAINGILLADGSKVKDDAKNPDLDIVDAMPLFHHSHNLTPMAEVALTQIDNMAQTDNRIIVGYYAACENYNDSSVEKCPSTKIAEKIAEFFPSALFAVIENKKLARNMTSPALKIHRFNDGKWKLQETSKLLFPPPLQQSEVLELVSHLLQWEASKDLVDFDNYLDDMSQDWSNVGIEKVVQKVTEKFES
ncbi:ER membrane protein complex subunit 8/9 homolog [Pieris napi]|uniref:ER membrane protein complex subunit 8/9 homolog n=1 Tax=Pieris napi TaxID=78633 RepID=UPI001FB89911|nr:ER membrane protein complex subunit 8/9 homolog [Pieris napi]